MKVLTIIFFVSLLSNLAAQIPRTISYQGLLTDAQGNFLPDGNRTLTLKLYDALNSTTAIYTESHTLPVVKGLFNAIIGSVNPIPSNLSFDKAYFLGVSVDFGTELTPRTPLTATPYALRAERATVAESLAPGVTGIVSGINGLQGNIQIQGGGTTTVNQSGNSITISSTGGNGIQTIQSSDATLTVTNPNGPIANVGIANNKVNSAHIVDGTITPADISGAGANHNDALIWDAPMLGTPQWVIRKPVSILPGPGITLTTASAGPLVYNVAAVDISATNEIQALSYNNGTKMLSLSNGGGSVDLSGLASGGTNPWTINGTHIHNNNTGNVGIGVTNPNDKLDVLGNFQLTNGILKFNNGGQAFHMNMRSNGQLAFEANGTAGDNTMVFDDEGDRSINIGTATARAGFKLNVNGKAYFGSGINFGSVEGFSDGGANQIAALGAIRPNSNNGFSLGTSTFRWSEVWATDGTINTSDRRLKKNINNLGNTLDKVMALGVKSWNWNSGKDQESKHIGFIAQDMQQIFPELVVDSEMVYNESTGTSEKKPIEYLGIRYNDMIAILTKAIQEQQQLIQKQDRELQGLKSELIKTQSSMLKLSNQTTQQ